jgi:hypothetical protein
MATLATAATGTIVKIATATIPELRNASEIGMTFAMAEVTAHDGNGWSSSIPTLKRGSPITLDINWVPGNATHIALLTAAQNRTSTAFSVIYPTAGNPTWTFNAFVGTFTVPSVPVDGALPLRVIITPDGAMTFA